MALLDVAASAVDPKTDPAWNFHVYIPGRSRTKGSQERRYLKRGNTTTVVLVEREVTQEWVATCSAYAMQERRRREAYGDKSFPYQAEMVLWPLFVYDRPARSSTRWPTGRQTYGDIEKLIRSVADALCPGTFTWNKQKVAKASVIADDSLIVGCGMPWKCFSDQTEQNLPAGAYLYLERAPDNKIDGSLYMYRRRDV